MAKPLKTKEELKQQTLSELEEEQRKLEEKRKKEEKRKRKEEEERKRREAVAKNLAAGADKNPLEKGAEQNLQKIAQQQKEAEARRKQETVAKNIAANANKNPLERAAEQNILRTEERLKEDRERQKLSEVAKNLVSKADRNPLEKAAEENIANLPVPEKEKPEIRPHQQNIPREDPAFRYMTADEKQKYELYKAITGEESAQKYLDFLTLQEQNKAISEEESAQKYLDSIREEVNRRQAEKIYSGNENEILSQYLLGAQGGLESAKTGFQDALKMFFEEGQARPTSTSEYLSERARNDLAEKGPKLPEALGGASLGQIGFDVVNTTANMLPSIMLGTLGGAAVGAAGIGASAAGNAYNSALREGYTQEQARNYGLLVGAAEASLGYLLGGIEATGGKIGKGAMAKLLPKIDNALARAAVNVGGKMGSEFTEEYLQEILDPMFRNLALLEENEIDFLSPEAIYAGILGALSAGGIAVAGGNASAPEVLQKAEVPVPFEGTAQPGTERELIANKITEIENRPISEAEKAAKMEEVAKAAAENGSEPGLAEEAEKIGTFHKERQAEFDEAVAIGKKLGVSVEFDPNIAGNGIHTGDGRIIINPNTENPALQVFVHELTHDIESSGIYQNFSEKILGHIKEQGFDLEGIRQRVKTEYAAEGHNLTDPQIDAEVVAKYCEQHLFTDEKAIQRLLDTDPNLFSRIKYWIEDMIVKFKGTKEERFLLEAQGLYEKALSTRGETAGAGISEESVGRGFDEMAAKARNQEYSAAIETGDMETAQRLVDEAAKEAGYDSPLLYHGTGSFGFTEFDLSKMDDKRSIFLTSNPRIASTYSGVEGKREIGKKEKTAENLSIDELVEQLNKYPGESFMHFNYKSWDFKKQKELIQEIDKGIKKLEIQVEQQIKEYAEKMAVDFDDEDARIHRQLVGLKEKLENGRYIDLSTPIYLLLHHTNVFNKNANEISKLEKNIRLLDVYENEFLKGNYEGIIQEGLGGYDIEFLTPQYAKKMLEEHKGMGNYGLYAKLGKALEIDATGQNWNHIESEIIGTDNTRGIAKKAFENGYDSVIFKGLYDNGGRNSNVDFNEQADIYVIFNPNNIKSADPVTYDNDGNVIPLSKRFKPEEKDFRYSTGSSFDTMAAEAKTEHGVSESVSAEISDSAKRVIEQMRPRKPKVQSSTGQVNPEPESTKLVDVPQSKKSERIERRYQRAVEDGAASVFGIDRSDIKNDIRPVLDEIAKDVKEGKKITDKQIDRLYKTAFENGYIKEEFPQYDEIRKYIRSAPVFVDEKTRHEFGDDFEFRDFARKNFGSIKFTTDPKARHLDEFFDNLSSMEPDFFDGFETDPKTQLEDIADFMKQTKKQYYGLSEVYSGTELSDFENWAKKELKAYMDEFSKGLDNVRRYERDRQIKATNKAREMDKTASFEQAKAAFENNKVFDARKVMEAVKKSTVLSDSELVEVKRLLEGTLTEGDVVALGGNVEGILAVYNAEKAYKQARAPFDRYKAAYKTAMQHDAIEATELSDEWNDKKIGFLYSRETAERNVKDIAGKGGRKVIEEYFEPIHENEAMKTRWIREMNRRVAGLELGKMNQWERAYAQMIGENAAYIASGRITKHDQHEHEALNERISALLSEHGNKIDKAKCEKAAAGFMEIYEDILDEWNDERIRRGQEPLGKIENYFPHFTETKPENTIQKIFSFFGFDINSSKLPTDIAGRTADRKPNTKYNPHAQRRTTDVTDYDILKGFDGYVRAVGDNIFHTEDIQKIRALSDTIRTKYSSAEIEKRIEDIRNRQDLSEEDKETLISEAFKSDPGAYHLSNFVVWLDEYANILAGKKSRGDRETEYQMGREIYDISKAIEGRIASNMIGYNLSTPVMNLVPMFQATADVSPVDIVSSFIQTGVAAARGDSFISDNSDFLTNRFGTDSVYKKNYNLFTSENMKDAVAKIQDGGAFLMEFVDRIAAESLVRARYQQNLKNGMDKVSAFSEADQWAAGLMADRSLGALPTVFNIKNPVAKALTMFQIEANNQYSYIFKDAGKYKAQDEGKASMITGQIAFWVAMAICNGLADELLGRDNVVPDPIGMSYDAIKKVAEGEPVGDVALDTATNVIEQLPFIGGLLGGGRVPLSTAFPDLEQGIKLFNPEVSGEKKKQILLDEITKPFSYLLLPSGAGQIWKTGKGIQQIAEGGAFGTENDGSKYMKFPQENDPESLLKTIIFGQYASDRGQQYIDSGFKDKLSAKQTEQMEQAENWGISNSEFYDIILGLKPYSKKEEKQEALFENEELSSGEKGILEQIIFGNAETRDYGSKEDFYRSGLTDSEKRLFDEGFYGGELDRLEKAIKSGEKKEDKILSIVKELGCSEAEAFEILQKRNGDWNSEIPKKESARAQSAADYYGMSEEDYLSVYNYKNSGENKEEIVENLMTANGWDRETAEENYNKVFVYEYSKEDLPEKAAADLDTSGNWYEVEEEAFFIARNIIKTAEGEKDEFGNTVSGSKKAEAISMIAKALGIDEVEATIYYLAANGDLAFSANDLSSSKQADLKAAISYGWTERQFLDAVNIIKLSGATKKDDIINALMEAGAPYDMAVGYYNLSKNYDYWKR